MPFGSDYYDEPMIGGFDPREQSYGNFAPPMMPDPMAPFQAYDSGSYDYQGPGFADSFFGDPGSGMTAAQLQAQTAAKVRYEQAQQMPDYLQGYDADSAERQRLLERVGNRQRYAAAGEAVSEGLANKSLNSAWLNGLSALSRGREAGDLARSEAKLKDRTQKSELMTRWTADRKAAADELMYAGGGIGRGRGRSRGHGSVGGLGGEDTTVSGKKTAELRAAVETYAPHIAEMEGNDKWGSGAEALAALRRAPSDEAMDQILGRFVPEYANLTEGRGWDKYTGMNGENLEKNRYTEEIRQFIPDASKDEMLADAGAQLAGTLSKMAAWQETKDPSKLSQGEIVILSVLGRPELMGEMANPTNQGGNQGSPVVTNIQKLLQTEEDIDPQLRRIARSSIDHYRKLEGLQVGYLTINPGVKSGGSRYQEEGLALRAKAANNDKEAGEVMDAIRSDYMARRYEYPTDDQVEAIFQILKSQKTPPPRGKGKKSPAAADVGVTQGPAILPVMPGSSTAEPVTPVAAAATSQPVVVDPTPGEAGSGTETVVSDKPSLDQTMAARNKGGVGSLLGFVGRKLDERHKKARDWSVRAGEAQRGVARKYNEDPGAYLAESFDTFTDMPYQAYNVMANRGPGGNPPNDFPQQRGPALSPNQQRLGRGISHGYPDPDLVNLPPGYRP